MAPIAIEIFHQQSAIHSSVVKIQRVIGCEPVALKTVPSKSMLWGSVAPQINSCTLLAMEASLYRFGTLLPLSLLLQANPAFAFKPAPPQPVTVQSSDHSVTIEIVPNATTLALDVTVSEPKGKHHWSTNLDFPSEFLVNPALEQVMFIGGHGDSGMSVGIIEVYSFEGQALKHLDLTKKIKNLKSISENKCRKICCNFPWASSLTLNETGDTLQIDVCGELTPTINLRDFTVSK